MITQKNAEMIYDAVPVEMQELEHWVMWNYEDKTDKNGQKIVDENGEIKRTKIPKQINGLNASSTDKATWIDFDTALENIDRFSGIGFMFQGSGIMGIDLDHVDAEITEYLDCLQNRPNEIENIIDTNIVAEVIELTQSYTEISPSGAGVHVFIKGELAGTGKKNHFIEIYDSGRFFTVTGNQIGRYTATNEDIGYIERLCEKYFPQKINEQGSAFEAGNAGNNFTIEELIGKIKASKSGQRFTDLFFDGTWVKYPQYPSQSEADMALASDLAWWTNYDIDKAEKMFRMSAMYREQWDRTGKYAWTRILNNSNGRGYGAKLDIDVEINLNGSKKIDFKQLRANAEPPTEEDFEEKNTSVLPDKNGVLWFLQTFASKDPEVRLVRKYYNYENMAKLFVDLQLNEFTEFVEAIKGDGSIALVDDAYISKMYRNVSMLYADIPQKDLGHIVNNVGREKTYHPIKDLIEKVSWDKQPRIETFFVDFFGLADTPYHGEATRKWFIGAIARLYNAGVKFDMTPVIRGAQGAGKTTAIEKLALKDDFYLSLTEKIDKDVYMLLRDSWLVELEELEFTRLNSEGNIKKFLTTRFDKFREPYGKNTREYKRHCVFIGTINDKTFLSDRTGNRRYYPMIIDDNAQGKLSPFDDLTKDYVHQLWAEALVCFKNNEKIFCSKETEAAFDVIRGNVMQEDVTEDTLLEFLDLELPQEYYAASAEQKRLYLNGNIVLGDNQELSLRPDITTKEILIECFGREIDGDLRGDKTAKKISNIMQNLPNWQFDKNLRRISVDGKAKYVRGYKRIS